MDRVDRTAAPNAAEIETTRPRRSRTSWGAILIGTVITLAALWFLQLLGATIGFGIIDLTDVGTGLAWAGAAWVLITSILAFGVGGMIAARMSGETDGTVGMLHGVGLWATTTVVMLVLGWMGMTAVVRGTASAVESTISATATGVGATVSTTAEGLGMAASGLGEASDSAIVDTVRARLKSEASSMLAGAAEGQDASVSAAEVERAIEAMDQGTLTRLGDALIAGETERAKSVLASSVRGLSEREIEALVDGVSQRVQEMAGTAGDDQSLREDMMAGLRGMIADRAAEMDAPGGTDVSAADLRAALADFDMELTQTVAWRLIRGDVDGARNAVVADTSLTEAEAAELVEGVQADVQTTIDEYSDAVMARADTVGDYVQGVLWLSLCTSALSLAATGLGGWLGTQPTRVVAASLRRPGPSSPVVEVEARGPAHHRPATPSSPAQTASGSSSRG